MIVIWIYLPKFRDPGDRDSDLVIKITRIKDTRDPDRKLIWTLEDKGCVKKRFPYVFSYVPYILCVKEVVTHFI